MKKLGFGLMRLPLTNKEDDKTIDIDKLKEMVDFFLKKGFNYFDTAYFYHGYESERAIKKALIERYDRSLFNIATKLPLAFVKEKSDIPRFFNEQLEKTGVSYFDYYLFHNMVYDRYKMATEYDAFSFINKKREEGIVKKFGFSFHDKPEVLDKILSEHPDIDFVQLQINYLDWEDENIQSRKCYEVAVKHGKPVIVMEPVKGGALSFLPKEAEKLLKEYSPDMSISSWAIRFSASLDNVFMVLSGMSNMEQLRDNISFMENFKPLNEEEKKLCFEASDIIKRYNKIPCTDCKYCVQKCPQGIRIPEYFKLYNNSLENLNSSKDTYGHLVLNENGPNACVRCKKCEEICPQHIEISECLKRVKLRLK